MRLNHYVFTVLLIIAGQSIHAQNGCEDLSQSFNYRLDEGTLHILKGIATPDDGMLLVGTTKSGDGAGAILIKLSVEGDVEWGRKLKNKSIGEWFDITSVVQLTDGKFAVAYRYGTPKKRKIGVMKLAKDGQKIWERDYRNNYGTATDDPIFLINAINEGPDGDLILNIYEDSDNRVKNGPGFTRIDSIGNVIWSIQYFGKIQIDHHNENAYKNGKLTFWGLVFEESCNGRSFFNSISIDYSTANIEKVIRYCISPENENISAVPDVQSTSFEHRSGYFSVGQANGETRLLMQNLNLNQLLFSRFDESLNFISAWRFKPHMIDSRFWFPNKAVDKMGNLVFRVLSFTGDNKNYLAHLKNGSKVPDQFIFDESEDGMASFLEFQNNGNVAQIINKNGTVSVNTLPDYLDVAFFCREGTDTTFGHYEDYKLTQHTSDYKWEEIRRRVYSAVPSEDIQFIPVAINRTADCKKISYCDQLQIIGDDKICLAESNRIHFKSEKNALCKRQIQWTVDSQLVDLERGADDSEIFLNIKEAGGFTLYGSVTGCDLKDSIVIEAFEKEKEIKIFKDSDLCPGKSVKLETSKGFQNYSWNTGENEKEIIIDVPGLYTVVATDYCGNTFFDTISVLGIDTSWSRNQQIHPLICKGDTMTIAVPAAAKNITWKPRESGILESDLLHLFPEKTTTYLLSGDFSNTCITETKLEVSVQFCPETIYFPNAFTPNGDGLNDIFQPTIGKPLIYFSFFIYNRFGQKIFETNNPDVGWDGRFKGDPLSSGIYAWVSIYQFKGKARQIKKGQIALLR